MLFNFFHEREEDIKIKTEKEREKNITWLPVIRTQNLDGTGNSGVCPGQKSSLQPLGLQETDDAPTN